MTKTPVFQSDACGRCGGTGRYSFNMMHGSMCYGCSGKGMKLTKAGRAAYDFYLASVSKPASEVAVGNKVWETVYAGMASGAGWMRVAEVNTSENGDVTFVSNHSKLGKLLFGYSPATLVQVQPTAEEREVKVAAALAYQATLGKNGKPVKATKRTKKVEVEPSLDLCA